MTSFHILHLCSDLEKVVSPFPSTSPKKPSGLVDSRKRWVLLFHRSKDTGSPILISGFTVVEYPSTPAPAHTPCLSFLDKLDSTGLFPVPPHTVRYFLQAFLQSVPQRLAPPCDLHVYAKSAPEYLFRHSQRNANKHVLADAAFLRWWVRTLGLVGAEEAYFYAPGHARAPVTLPPRGWHDALPWAPHASPTTLPRLPDDELGRFVQQHPAATVQELVSLWDALAAPWTAHITLRFQAAVPCLAVVPEATVVPKKALEAFAKYLTALDFGPDRGLASCDALWKYIQKQKWSLHAFDDAKIRESYKAQGFTDSAPPVPQVTNDLSFLVKKKSSTARPTQNAPPSTSEKRTHSESSTSPAGASPKKPRKQKYESEINGSCRNATSEK